MCSVGYARSNLRVVNKTRIYEIITMRVDGGNNIYCKGNPEKKSVEKRVKISHNSYLNKCKKLDNTLAPGDEAKPFTTAYRSYGTGGANHLISVVHFHL